MAMVASGVVGQTPAGATHPGINGKIACQRTFGSGPTANTEVFTFNPNGTELEATNLTNHAAFDGRPKYSPDGRLIAFESNRSGSTEIWIMNADGSNPRRLTFTGANSAATWHPDGSQIMFQSSRTGQFQLFKIFVDGTGEQQITNLPQESTLPNWSPDGTRVAFSSRRQDPAADVHIMDPFGQNVVNLTNSPAEDSWPSWSPDGSQIAFHSRRLDAAGEEIYRMAPVPGSPVTRLTHNINPASATLSFDIFPFYSPDGTRIGWNSGRNGEFGEVYHMDSIVGDLAPIHRVTNSPLTEQRCDWQPLCTIYGSGNIVGTAGDDIICGSDGNDNIAGMGGNDRILGLGGNDSLSGGEGNDTLFGGLGVDRLVGSGGIDFLSAGPGDDFLAADTGERLDVGAGRDTCVVGGAQVTCPERLS